MLNLLRQLKPHSLALTVIIIFQIFRAYLLLLLPEYTSGLIDTGIQNSGFEYAVPLQLTASDYHDLSKLMLPNEKKVLTNHYQLNDQGVYEVDVDPVKNKKTFAELEQTFTLPLALSYFMTNGAEMAGTDGSATSGTDSLSLEMLKRLPAVIARPMVDEKLKTMSPQILKSSAIGYVKETYETAGNNISAFQWGYISREGGIMMLVAFGSVLVSVGAHYFAARVGANIGYRLRQQTFAKVMNFSQVEINNFSTASLITRGTNDIQQIQLLITILLRFTLFAPILAVGGIYQVIKTEAKMTWIIVLAVTVVIVVVGGLLLLTMPRFKRLQKQIDQLNLFAREYLTGLQVIRAFGRENYENQRFDKANFDLMSTQLFVNRTMAMMLPLMMLVMNGTSILIVWVAGFQIADGSFQVGQMTAFITYTIQIIFAFLIFSMVAVMLPRAMVSADRVQEVIDTDISIKDPIEGKVIAHPRGQIEFRNVSFHFQDANQNTLAHINFVAEPGQTTAIVGSTGSGKTTLLNLLLRFYDVTEGEILIDGVDIREMKQAEIRDMIGYVPQKGVLFSGTIASNIKYSDSHIPDPLMISSADIAHATEFINEKKEKYQAAISQGGSNVSGGQKQRLSIARAIAKEPLIYLFDDSFSALDYRTDVSLRAALDKTTDNKTVVIIAQRISTILNADKIIVLDEGSIVGIGTHEELLKTSNVYMEIASSQLSQAEIQKSLGVDKAMEGGDLHV